MAVRIPAPPGMNPKGVPVTPEEQKAYQQLELNAMKVIYSDDEATESARVGVAAEGPDIGRRITGKAFTAAGCRQVLNHFSAWAVTDDAGRRYIVGRKSGTRIAACAFEHCVLVNRAIILAFVWMGKHGSSTGEQQ